MLVWWAKNLLRAVAGCSNTAAGQVAVHGESVCGVSCAGDMDIPMSISCTTI